MLPRRAVPLLLFLAFVASSALGQSADLKVSIDFPLVVARANRPFYYGVMVQNLGPDAAGGVAISSSLSAGAPECSYMFTQPLAAGQTTGITCMGTAPNADTVISVKVNVTSATADPDPANNTATKSIAVVTNPDLAVDVAVPLNIEPGLPFETVINYWNSGGGDALSTTVRLRLPPGVEARTVPPSCRTEFSYVECDLGTIPLTVLYDATKSVKLQLLAPDTWGGGNLIFIAEISNSRPEIEWSNNRVERIANLYRAFIVASNADSGEGSLRQAITDANAQCGNDPCEVQFRLDTAGTQWASIRPRSPLPAVTALNLIIDGSTQTRFGGNTNPAGPEIEINGAGQSEGDGLVIESACNSLVGSLALNGFAGSAVRLHSSATCTPPRTIYRRSVTANYIGLDPTGTTAVPNFRGITVQNYGGAAFLIDGNVISGNTRAALFIDSPGTGVGRNNIGLDATATKPLGNGASGIFVSRNASNTDIGANIIAFNHEFGIAIERGTRLTEIHGNSIHANWQPGIDIGLDGATAETDDPGAPQIVNAHYDPQTNTTIIEGISEHANGTFGPIIRIFANDAPDRSGYGQGQYSLGEIWADRGGLNQYTFRFTCPGDLRGKFIAATATRVYYYGWLRIGDPGPDESSQGFERQTSEFSRTVEVH